MDCGKHMSENFNHIKLAKEISDMRNQRALQKALQNLDTEVLTTLETAISHLKLEYQKEVCKKDNVVNRENTKLTKFDKIISDIHYLYELSFENGVICENSVSTNSVLINFNELSDLMRMIANIDSSETNFSTYLKQLNNFEINFSIFPLLISFYRGMFYENVKTRNNWNSKFAALRLRISYRTIDKYISLHRLLRKYPLLIKLKQSASDLIEYSMKIETFFLENEAIKSSFQRKIDKIIIIFHNSSNNTDLLYEFKLNM